MIPKASTYINKKYEKFSFIVLPTKRRTVLLKYWKSSFWKYLELVGPVAQSGILLIGVHTPYWSVNSNLSHPASDFTPC